MLHITKSLERFTASFEQGRHIVCDQQGNWSIEGGIVHAVRWLKGGESARLTNIADSFCTVLDRLEKTPVVFSDNERVIRAQHSIYQPYIKAAGQIMAELEKCTKPLVQDKLFAILQKTIALKYRLEGANGGLLSCEIDADQFARLKVLAQEWKNSQKLIVEKALIKRDIEKIEEACRYPEFAKLLESNETFRKNFFKWTVRDNCDVQLFVEFPATVKRLEESHLYSRISRIGNNAISILKQERVNGIPNTADKVITMPFYDGKETKRYNILDESQIVEFYGGVRASIKEVFDVFLGKDLQSGNYEMFRNGIANWNDHEIGPWNEKTQQFDAIDLDKPQWWNQLPLVMTQTREEIEKMYDVKLQPGEWLTCAMGARKSPDLDLDNAHGYLKVFAPMADGSYAVYPLGKLAVTFPHTLIEFLKVLVSTNKAKIFYLDENIFYFFRQHANYPIVLSARKGEELMELIKADIIKGREGNLVFQFSGENCAHWVQNILDRLFHDEPGKIPNLFVMPLLKAEPNNFVLKGLFGAFKKAPKKMHPYLLNGLARILGSSSGRTVMENGQPVFKTTYQNSHRYNGTSYQPAHLHKKIQTGKLKGVLTTGY